MANERKLTPEMFEKCKEAVLTAKSAEEILAFAKKNAIEMSVEEAAGAFARYHKSGELSDDELDNVAGGGCNDNEREVCKKCGGELQYYWFDYGPDLACPVCDADYLAKNAHL